MSRSLALVTLAATTLLLLAGLSVARELIRRQASFPGTNGVIACSGPLGPNPPR